MITGTIDVSTPQSGPPTMKKRDERRGQEALGHLGERRQLSLGHRAERDDGHQDI